MRSVHWVWEKVPSSKGISTVPQSVQECLLAQGMVKSQILQPSTRFWQSQLWTPRKKRMAYPSYQGGYQSIHLSFYLEKEREKGEEKRRNSIIFSLAAGAWKSFCTLVYYNWLRLMELWWCIVMGVGIVLLKVLADIVNNLVLLAIPVLG